MQLGTIALTTTGALSISKRIQNANSFQSEEGESPIAALEREMGIIEEGLENIENEIGAFGITDEHQRKALFRKLDVVGDGITLLKKEIKKANKEGIELGSIDADLEALDSHSIQVENLITDTSLSQKTRLSFLPIGQRAIIEKVFHIIKKNLEKTNADEVIKKIIEGLK